MTSKLPRSTYFGSDLNYYCCMSGGTPKHQEKFLKDKFLILDYNSGLPGYICKPAALRLYEEEDAHSNIPPPFMTLFTKIFVMSMSGIIRKCRVRRR
jgi:hypothetical protein